MTLATQIERVLGEERFRKIKDYTLSDTAQAVLGEQRFRSMKNILRQRLMEWDFKSEKTKRVGGRTYEALRDFGNETYYGFIVDAVAQNLTSLVYALNDRFMAGQRWHAVVGTRINAAIGNTLTGRPYGAWQDYVIAKGDDILKISSDPNKYRMFLKDWAAKTGAFATGQSWLYALFLMSGNAVAGEPTDYEKLARGVATLTILAPLLGPYSDKVYQGIRKQFGLPAVPKYREEKQLHQAETGTATNSVSLPSVQ